MWQDRRALGLQILGYYGYGGYRPGGFLESLLTTWGKADTMNRSRLALGFSELYTMLTQFELMGPEAYKTWLDRMEDGE